MKKIYAVMIENGKEVARKEIGAARFSENNTISARKYSELRRNLIKAFKNIKSQSYVDMITEDGLKCTNGVNRTYGYMKFE